MPCPILDREKWKKERFILLKIFEQQMRKDQTIEHHSKMQHLHAAESNEKIF